MEDSVVHLEMNLGLEALFSNAETGESGTILNTNIRISGRGKVKSTLAEMKDRLLELGQIDVLNDFNLFCQRTTTKDSILNVEVFGNRAIIRVIQSTDNIFEFYCAFSGLPKDVRSNLLRRLGAHYSRPELISVLVDKVWIEDDEGNRIFPEQIVAESTISWLRRKFGFDESVSDSVVLKYLIFHDPEGIIRRRYYQILCISPNISLEGSSRINSFLQARFLLRGTIYDIKSGRTLSQEEVYGLVCDHREVIAQYRASREVGKFWSDGLCFRDLLTKTSLIEEYGLKNMV